MVDKKIWTEDFLGLIFLAVICNMGVSLLIPIIPLLMKSYGFSTQQMSAVFFAQVLARFLSANIAGYLLTRINSYKVLWGALGIYIPVMACFPFVRTFPPFVILRACEGIFEGLGIVSINNLVISLSTKDDRGPKMGYFTAAFGLGFILGPPFGAFAYGVAKQFGLFWSTGSLAMIGFIWLIFKHRLFSHVCEIDPSKTPKNIFQSYDKTFIRILPFYSPLVLRRVLLLSFAILLPLYLNEIYNLPATKIAFYFTGSAIITTSLMPFTGKILNGTLCKWKVIVALLVMGFCVLGFGFVSNPISFTILYIIETVAFSFLIPGVMKLFGDIIEAHPKRGQILGAGTGLAELSAVFVPITVLPLYKINYMLPWILLSSLALSASIPFWKFRHGYVFNDE